jgi:hypothetical protein
MSVGGGAGSVGVSCGGQVAGSHDGGPGEEGAGEQTGVEIGEQAVGAGECFARDASAVAWTADADPSHGGGGLDVVTYELVRDSG